MYVSVVSDWLEITSPSSVWISGPCCWWFDEQNNTQCKNEEKGSLLIFSCKMLLQTQTHSDRTASLKWLNDLNSLFTFNYSPVRDLNRVLRGSKLNHGAWIMLRFLYQQIYFKKPNEIFLSLAPICWQKVCLRVEMDGEIYRRWGKFMFLSKHTCSCGEVTQRRCDPVDGLTGGGDVVTACRFRDVFVTDDEYRCFSPVLWVLITTHTCSHCAEGTHTFRNTHVF